mmetsp:Transcript_68162/g.158184  ORF Transcript_68162/g.158184 Transcript_68162/m.158184 type:complete len:205 (+) Transcript_68162:851-1465(+)
MGARSSSRRGWSTRARDVDFLAAPSLLHVRPPEVIVGKTRLAIKGDRRSRRGLSSLFHQIRHFHEQVMPTSCQGRICGGSEPLACEVEVFLGRGRSGCTTSARDGLHLEVVELDAVCASLRIVASARALRVAALAVHPEHVVGAPVAHHRGHARAQRRSQLTHAWVVVDPRGNRAGLAVLRQLHLHGAELALYIHRERCCNVEG